MRSYYIFIFMYYITKPVRFVMDLIPFAWMQYNDFEFCVKYLFGNEYKVNFVIAQAMHESGQGVYFKEKHKSMLAEKYWNYFGMGYWSGSKYQDGKWNSQKPGEPVFATYKNIARGVYDYYDYVTKRKPKMYQAINSGVPTVPYDAQSYETKAYTFNVFIGLHNAGYFTADPAKYAADCVLLQRDIDDVTVPFWFNILVTLVLVGILVYIVRSIVLPFIRGAKKSKEGQIVKVSLHEHYKALSQRYR